MSSYYPIKIQSLTPREQVIDAMNRLYAGFDDSNIELAASAFAHSDEIAVKLGGKVINGWTNLREEFIKNVMPVSTIHQLTNFRVIFESGTAAKLTAHCVAHHSTEERGYYSRGGLAEVSLVYDEADDLWKIVELTMKGKWVS